MSGNVSYVVPPTPLQYVNEVYYRGVFGDVHQTISERIDDLVREGGWINMEMARFFDYLISRIDRNDFSKLQKDYLDPPVPRGCVKYLDPISWFEHKFKFALLLGLHQRPPMRVLDLGTGATHFMVIAEFFGHEAYGTDLPPVSKQWDAAAFYDRISAIFGTSRIYHRVEPDVELSGLPENIDVVTAFSVAFNLYGGSLWGTDRWEFFLKSLKRSVLSDQGELFMTLMNNKVDADVWNYLSGRATYSSERKKEVLIRDFSF